MADNINTLILTVLNEGEHYGLDIIKRIGELSEDNTEIKQPSLYSALRRLEEKGFVESYWEDGDEGGRRHYYKITELGQEELKLVSSVKEFKKAREQPEQEVDKNDINEQDDIDAPPFDIDEDDSFSADENTNKAIDESVLKDLDAFSNGSSAEIANFNPYEDEDEEDTETEETESDNDDEEISDLVFNDKDDNETQTEVDNIPLNDADIYPPIAPNEVVASDSIFKEESKNEFDNINYKDILGDLEADNFDDFEDRRTKIIETSISSMPTINNATNTSPPIEKAPEKQKSLHTKYTQQVAEIFSKKGSKSSSQVPASPTFGIKNKSLQAKLADIEKNKLEEVANKYDAKDKLPNKKNGLNPLQKLVSKDVGYTHIKQADITLRPYNKKSYARVNTNKFILSNQLNLFRAILLTILLFGEMLICYQTTSQAGYYLDNHYYYYIVFGALGIVYLLISSCIYARDINKKREIDKLHLWQNLGVRTAFACLLSAFSIGACFCLGMTELFDFNFCLLWIFPTIIAINLIISWLIGLIILLIHLFRA